MVLQGSRGNLLAVAAAASPSSTARSCGNARPMPSSMQRYLALQRSIAELAGRCTASLLIAAAAMVAAGRAIHSTHLSPPPVASNAMPTTRFFRQHLPCLTSAKWKQQLCIQSHVAALCCAAASAVHGAVAMHSAHTVICTHSRMHTQSYACTALHYSVAAAVSTTDAPLSTTDAHLPQILRVAWGPCYPTDLHLPCSHLRYWASCSTASASNKSLQANTLLERKHRPTWLLTCTPHLMPPVHLVCLDQAATAQPQP